jgi:hypothetical protein
MAVVLACSVPLALTAWALLDAARRPEWAWALAGRRRVVWLAVILFGAFTVVGGLVIAGAYLVRVRPEVAAAESGDVGARPAGRGPKRSSGGGP